MAKKLDSPCLFCGGLPCVCGGGATTKKSSTRTRKAGSEKKASTPTKKSPDTTPLPSATEVPSEDVFGAIPTQAKPRFKITPTSGNDRDLSYESALRLLRPLCSGPTQRGIDKELNHPYPQDVDRRVAQWKGRK